VTLQNNRELYDYLITLRDKLNERGAAGLGAKVDHASRCAAGISTEFLGESKIALRAVYRESESLLQSAEKDELADVLRQLDLAFDRRK